MTIKAAQGAAGEDDNVTLAWPVEHAGFLDGLDVTADRRRSEATGMWGGAAVGSSNCMAETMCVAYLARTGCFLMRNPLHRIGMLAHKLLGCCGVGA